MRLVPAAQKCYLWFRSCPLSLADESLRQPDGDDVQSSQGDTTPKDPLVLVADDDPFLRELIGAQLRGQRYRVVEAESGDEALPLLQAGDIDILVTDISMPGTLDGWALAERARLVQPGIAVVYASSRPADAARQVSGSLYLRKPFRSDAIAAAVRQLPSWRNDDSPAEA